MTPSYDITINQGATFSLILTYYTDDTETTPVDLSGYTARMQIREFKDSADTIADLTTENGGITLGGALGTITLSISATDTEDLAFPTSLTGVYDLELVSGATVTRLVEGNVYFNLEVTR